MTSTRGPDCVPYWSNDTKNWSNRLLSCLSIDLKCLQSCEWNNSFKKLADNSWFTVRAHKTYKNSLNTLSQLIEPPNPNPKPNPNTKVNNNSGRAIKIYEHPLRARKIKVHLK